MSQKACKEYLISCGTTMVREHLPWLPALAEIFRPRTVTFIGHLGVYA